MATGDWVWLDFKDLEVKRGRVVAREYPKQLFSTHVGKYHVITSFMGIELPDGHFFETMVFPEEDEEIQLRYATYKEAKAGHEYVVRVVMTLDREIVLKPSRVNEKRLLNFR